MKNSNDYYIIIFLPFCFLNITKAQMDLLIYPRSHILTIEELVFEMKPIW